MSRYSLSVRLALFFSFIVLLVTTALSAVVFYQFDDKINQQISRNLTDIADHKAVEINNALLFERTNLLSWRASSVMLDVVVDDLDKRIATELINLKQSYQLQGDLYVFNAAGALIASTQQNALKTPLPKAWQSQKDYALVFKHEVPFICGSIIAHVAALKPPHLDRQGYLVMTHSWADFSRLLEPKDISFALHKAHESSHGSAELFTANGVKTIEINDALKRPLWFFDGISYLGSISKAVAFDGFNFQIAAFMPENLAEKPLFELTQSLLLAAALVGLPILAMVNLLSRHLVTPIKKLTATIRTIEDSNDLSIQVPVSGRDEVADLGFAFNRMTTRLGELFHKCSVVENELENLNHSLEHQVIERTAQLQGTLLDLRIAATAFESQEAIVITDTESVILRINKAFTESTGYTEQEAVGRKISILKSGHHDADFYREMWGSLLTTGAWQGEIWDRRKNGEIYPKWLVITAVKGADGITTHYVGTHADITERKAAEEQIKLLAFYDPLTRLPNRRLLQERLKHAIHVERREGKLLGLLMLDLDRFKAVNDSLGHLAGDGLLQQVASRITARLREVDMVARLGGDEFIVLLEDIAQPEDAARVAEEIIADLTRPFCLVQSNNVQIGASIGICIYPQHGDTSEILMDHSDTALYQAKNSGRGCFAYFSEDLTLIARERMELESRLRRAIEQQELCVFYQPQVDIASGLIVGAEALVRWQDPVEGLILPIRFIPIAEETGLILPIGDWVLRETCRQGRQWLDAGLPPLTLAVNVSSYQFRRSDVCALVTTVLAETGFPSGQLELEITESGLMGNQDNATAILNSLRALGVRLAIDDFGTGYSSLAYLKHFPLDVLKIDKSFIDDIPFHQDDMEIAATIVAMGHILGIKVLAEGVETPGQLAFLQEKGCDMYQGYIKSGPLPAHEFAELLRNQVHG